jgi:dipeptidyl aminopeptidase/acylaminoacyl peptidase
MCLTVLAAPAEGHDARFRVTGVIDWVTWAPGQTILFQAHQGVLSIQPDGSGLRRIAGPNASRASWSPTRAAIVMTLGEGVAVAPPEGKRLRKIRRQGDYPAWSPSGDRIAFNAGRFVRVMDADGSDARVRGSGGYSTSFLSGPRWSPTGRQLAYGACTRRVPESDFCEHVKRGSGVFVSSADRRGRDRRVAYGHCPDWSARGLLAYNGARGVVISRPDGSARRLAIGVPLRCSSWSPDGRLVAAETERGVVVAGSGRARLVARLPPLPPDCDLFASSPPAWSPDGRSIALPRPVGTCDRQSFRLYVIRVRDGKARIIVRTPPS